MTSLLHPARGSRRRELFAVLNARQPANRGPNPFYGGKDLPTQALAEGSFDGALAIGSGTNAGSLGLGQARKLATAFGNGKGLVRSRRTVATEGRAA